MDNFMDKLVEKINMQNSRAKGDRAVEEESYTRTEIEQFKNSTHDELESLKKELIDQLESRKEDAEATKSLLNDNTDRLIREIGEKKSPSLEEVKDSVSDIIHKEDVKLYRNVQAVVSDENKKTIEKLEAIDKSIDKSEEFNGINKRLEDIESVEGAVAGRTSGLKGLVTAAIILLALNLAGVGIIIARLFGMI